MTDLEQAVAKLAARRHGVVVATITGDRVEVRGTAGLDASTRFEIGSVTKVFTALTLARLVVAGAVTLDEPLRDFGFPVPTRGGAPITLRHLATHTSGLPRLPTGMLLGALLRPSQPDPYAGCSSLMLSKSLERTRLSAEPGRKFRYSNFGAGLLGLALSRRTGLNYEALVAREISGVLRLTATSVAGAVTQGYRKVGRPVPPWNLADLTGAGGLRSTVADLAVVVRAQWDPESELAPAAEAALGVEHRVNPFLTARLGWFSRRVKGSSEQFFHNGGTGGFVSFVGFDRERRVGVVALSDTRRPVDGAAFELLTALPSGR
ncbi:CubicO group peptidase (beta-lactamase class C family) [Actinoplanes lutulentus]|uniref:serine hydrolase domain-containing protein n=1 Tax=Actinoplanes lutulentus TaxID=1287878 RepID=UPI0015EB2D4C|nr:serine hydrolase domain-containing protein [Actinoplanes lutulentus]MBB2943570.1 CubicO group peptidase (beta-lactamase class C family) [Actinoplanes lutulentus]